MKRRAFRVLLPLVALGLVAAACGGDDDEDTSSATTAGGAATTESTAAELPAGSTMAALRDKGKILIGVKFDQPLFGFKNPTNNQVEGFDVEIGKLLAEKIYGDDAADNVEFIETVSRVREESIEQGKVDLVIATYTINDARKQRVDFAGPYYTAGQDILVKKDDTSIKGVQDLNGKKVCSVQGSTSLTNVQQQAPQADVSITFERYSQCVEAMLDGRVQAVTTDNVILLGFVNDDPDTVKLVNNPFTQEPYGIGLKKGDTVFRNWINDQLEAFGEDGSYEEAWTETAGQTGQPTPPAPVPNRY
jgi:glutamate transport system substrate-binding protein